MAALLAMSGTPAIAKHHHHGWGYIKIKAPSVTVHGTSVTVGSPSVTTGLPNPVVTVGPVNPIPDATPPPIYNVATICVAEDGDAHYYLENRESFKVVIERDIGEGQTQVTVLVGGGRLIVDIAKATACDISPGNRGGNWQAYKYKSA